MRLTLEPLEPRDAPSALLPQTETLASFRQAYPGAVTHARPGYDSVADLYVKPGADAGLLPGEREVLHNWYVPVQPAPASAPTVAGAVASGFTTGGVPPPPPVPFYNSIDPLVLDVLYTHNRGGGF